MGTLIGSIFYGMILEMVFRSSRGMKKKKKKQTTTTTTHKKTEGYFAGIEI